MSLNFFAYVSLQRGLKTHASIVTRFMRLTLSGRLVAKRRKQTLYVNAHLPIIHDRPHKPEPNNMTATGGQNIAKPAQTNK